MRRVASPGLEEPQWDTWCTYRSSDWLYAMADAVLVDYFDNGRRAVASRRGCEEETSCTVRSAKEIGTEEMRRAADVGRSAKGLGGRKPTSF
jgi:hypothetical protein